MTVEDLAAHLGVLLMGIGDKKPGDDIEGIPPGLEPAVGTNSTSSERLHQSHVQKQEPSTKHTRRRVLSRRL